MLRAIRSAAPFLLGGAAVVLALAGCAGSPVPESTGNGSEQPAASEVTELVVGCLQDAGWDVILQSDGYEIRNLTEAQTASYELDEAECQEASGWNDMAAEELTPERLSVMYDDELVRADCLRAEGFDVPEAPSRQSYIDRYTGEDPWYAYKFVEPADLSEAEWTALQEKCPQT